MAGTDVSGDLPAAGLGPADSTWATPEPSREDVDAMAGTVLLEFGAPWCGHCIAAAPLVSQALDGRADIRHVRIEDGRGRRLGRSFTVKLWPTFVLLQDGIEQARAVRPRTPGDLAPVIPARSG